MKIFIIGLPGSGKTTVGKQLAAKLGHRFVDLDDEIVKKSGFNVVEIFQKLGHERFREIERDLLQEWCQSPHDFVMATGGGTPCFHQNIELINNSGISVFINTDISEITSRMLSGELAKRPLFADVDASTIEENIKKMSIERMPYYKKAKLTFEGRDINASTIMQRLVASKG